MSRKCPFCRKEIEPKETDCPYCHRVIIEKIYKSSVIEDEDLGNANSNRAKTGNSAKCSRTKSVNFSNFTKRSKSSRGNSHVYQYDKWKKYTKISFLVVGLFVVLVFLYAYYVGNSSTDVERTYFSLPNGTILNSVPRYLRGLGELEIENGTDLDAVVKLVRSYSKKSIYTVYIKAKSAYTIDGISDGVHEVYFAEGKDWDKESRGFLVNSSCSKFEDRLEFTTTERQYTNFKITLHSVLGGSAQTDRVSENVFSQF